MCDKGATSTRDYSAGGLRDIVVEFEVNICCYCTSTMVGGGGNLEERRKEKKKKEPPPEIVSDSDKWWSERLVGEDQGIKCGQTYNNHLIYCFLNMVYVDHLSKYSI